MKIEEEKCRHDNFWESENKTLMWKLKIDGKRCQAACKSDANYVEINDEP